MVANIECEIAAERDALIEHLLQATFGVWDIYAVYLGHRLGLYEGLAKAGPSTSVELATSCGLAERYVREWLEQQTVSGIVRVEDESAEPTARRYRLPAAHAEVLTEQESLNYLAPLAQIVVGAAQPIHAVLEAFRTGGGVPYGAFGEDLRRGQAGMNRNLFLYQLGADYLPAMPDVHARLQNAARPARIADVGCGLGWSSIGMARAYPHALVDGFDLDEPSVAEAQVNVRAAGLEDRVVIHLRDAADPALAGRYDLVTAFECVHDMSDPVGALRTMRRLAADGGTVLIMDERVGETFSAAGGDVERFMYGFSMLHCLPVGMADQPSAGTGTVMRPPTLHRYAQEAGFRYVEILPVENYFFNFYRLVL